MVRQQRNRARNDWKRLSNDQRAEIEASNKVPANFGELAIEGDLGLIVAKLSKEHQAAGTINLPVHVDYLRRFDASGNPLWALLSIGLWPDEPLAPALRSYLQRSLAPLIETTLQIMHQEPDAPTADAAMRTVAEWFGLKGRPGQTNAFAEVRREAEREIFQDAASKAASKLKKQMPHAVATTVNNSQAKSPAGTQRVVTEAQVRHRLRSGKRKKPSPR